MPRLYIDTDDGTNFCIDDEGAISSDLARAKAEILEALPAMLQDMGGPDGQSQMSAVIRDEAGSVLLRARIQLTVETFAAPCARPAHPHPDTPRVAP